MTPLVLEACGYRLVVVPDFGGSVLEASWQAGGGTAVDLLRAFDVAALRPGLPAPVGCFPMAPFANRIDGGLFTFEGETVALPIDRPDETVAIHGLSRFAAFSVVSVSRAGLRLRHRHRGPVFAYDLDQDFAAGPEGLSIDLRVTNRGRRMPYGLGLHPFLVREADARLRFSAAARFERDARYLPVAMTTSGPAFGAGATLADLEGFDAHYTGWAPRVAVLERPAAALAVTVSGHGALTNLHVYVPPGGGLVCVEPVSHVPDVQNRRRFAAAGDLAILETGESMRGGLRIEASRRRS